MASSSSYYKPPYSHLLPYTVRNCVALQIMSDIEVPLSEGDLTLQLPTVTSSARSPSTEQPPATTSRLTTTLSRSPGPSPTYLSSSLPPTPILLAFVGKTLFPLYKDTKFGTFTNSPRQYAFDFQLSKDKSTQVRLVLPDDVTESVQDGFEEILIQSGLLLTGLRAAGDEIMRGAREGGKINAERIKQGTREHIANTPRVVGDDAPSFSKGTHQGAANVNSGANTVYQYALGASNAVASAAGSAGAGIMKGVSSINESLPASLQSRETDKSKEQKGATSDMSDMRLAINEAASGIAEGTSNVTSTAQESASSAISHNYGDEAQGLASSAGDTLVATGKSAGNVFHSASLLGMSASAVEGALQDKEEKEAK